jgi:putative transcriptional regulator
MSQAVFARVLSVSPKTVQSWEQGVRVSSESARRLIHVFAQQPDVVCQIVGLPKVQLYGFKIVEKKKGKRQIVRALRAPRPEHGPNDRG